MFAKKEFEKRCREILEELDALAEDFETDEDAGEQLDELNAEYEDALYLLSEIDPEEEDAAEALEDALDEFVALYEDYRALAETIAEIDAPVRRLGMVVEMMKNNI